jgi:capsular polysaccharide biosynthesis protein
MTMSPSTLSPETQEFVASDLTGDTTNGLRHLGEVIKRWWLLILIGTVFAVGMAGVALAASPTQYVASSDVLLAPPSLQQSGQNSAEDVRKVNDLTGTLAQLITSDEVLTAVVQDTGTKASVSDLRSGIKVTSIPSTLVLHIEVARADRDQATAVAKAVVNRFSERLKTLGTDGTTATQPVTAVSLRAPSAAAEANNALRTLLIALIIGFGFSTLVAFTLDRS